MKTIACGLALVVVCLTSTMAGGGGDSPQFSSWSNPMNLGPVVNSTSTDNTPCISRDGLNLYFNSTRPGGFGTTGDLYVSQRPTTVEPWGTPMILLNVNTSAQEYWPTLSPDGHRMYFSRFLNHDGNNNFDLYVSRRHNKKDPFGWEPAVPVDELNTADFNETALGFFEEEATGRLMAYFGSNQLGSADLFMTWLQDDGTFAPPTPVDDLNTPDSERLATIRRDGLEVFFNRAPASTPGAPGLLYTSTRSSTAALWSQPVLMPAPVNDPITVRDLAPRLSFDGTQLYFSSSRGGSFGGLDIWVSTRTKLKGN